MGYDNTAALDSRSDYKDTPRGQFEYWSEELGASQKTLKKFHKQGDRIVGRFLDSKRSVDEGDKDGGYAFRLNIFHSNIVTLQSMLYGNLPKVDVSRRNADAKDDVARVAAETLERLLNNDIADHGEEYNSVLRGTLQDRLLAGLGCARVRYDVQMGNIDGQEIVLSEQAPIDYYFWRDVTWGWARTFSEIPWIGFRSYLTKDEVNTRFGEYAAENCEYSQQKVKNDEAAFEESEMGDVWNKAEIWEIWDKKQRKVVWLSKGCKKVLDSKDDPLNLSGFYPCPPFFIANVTSSLYVPTADYHLAQDLYREVDELQTRISILTDAVKAVGVYDKSNEEIGRVFDSGDNTLIPVDNYALLAEKGGLRGTIDWVPVEAIVGALDKLVMLRDQTIGLLQQVTGMSDVLRGGGQGQYEGVGQVTLRAKLSSVRIQSLQDEFATFASDLMQLKAEVISKHFSPETIAQMSNMGASYDIELLPQAIDLIKDSTRAQMRVAIRPESVAMVDYAQLKSERTDYMNALSTFMQSSAPLIQMNKSVMPFLLQLLQWGLSGFKGAGEIEGVIDQAITVANQEEQQQQENKPPSPEEMEMQRRKAEMDMEMQKMERQAQLEVQKIQAKAQADMQVREHDLKSDVQTGQALLQTELVKVRAEMDASIREITAKMRADIQTEIAQSQANAEQSAIGTQGEIQKETIKTALDIQKESAKAQIDMEKETNKNA